MIEPAGTGVGFASLPADAHGRPAPGSNAAATDARRRYRPADRPPLAGRRPRGRPAGRSTRQLPRRVPAEPCPRRRSPCHRSDRRHPGRDTGIGVPRCAHPPPRPRGISHTRAASCASGATNTASERMQVILPASYSSCASVIVSDTWQLSCCPGLHVDDFPRRLPAGIHIEAPIDTRTPTNAGSRMETRGANVSTGGRDRAHRAREGWTAPGPKCPH